mmetsp:Transcript_94279/g.224481  ORF Transcript_94279/g.224481 Transcript_94279/m.224481 type:complete len:253 (+) Transcript_94279:100-858(+)
MAIAPHGSKCSSTSSDGNDPMQVGVLNRGVAAEIAVAPRNDLTVLLDRSESPIRGSQESDVHQKIRHSTAAATVVGVPPSKSSSINRKRSERIRRGDELLDLHTHVHGHDSVAASPGDYITCSSDGREANGRCLHRLNAHQPILHSAAVTTEGSPAPGDNLPIFAQSRKGACRSFQGDDRNLLQLFSHRSVVSPPCGVSPRNHVTFRHDSREGVGKGPRENLRIWRPHERTDHISMFEAKLANPLRVVQRLA